MATEWSVSVSPGVLTASGEVAAHTKKEGLADRVHANPKSKNSLLVMVKPFNSWNIIGLNPRLYQGLFSKTGAKVRQKNELTKSMSVVCCLLVLLCRAQPLA
jgi:hypothetical protein